MTQPTPKNGSLVDHIARTYVAPAALYFDIYALSLRVVEPSMQRTLPALYAAWQRSADTWYYGLVHILAIFAFVLIVAASMYLIFPLLTTIQHRIENAQQIGNAKRRKAFLTYLKGRRKRYVWVAGLAGSMVVCFGLSAFILDPIGGVVAGTFAAVLDIITPIIGLFCITQSEHEYDVDAVERTRSSAQDVLIARLEQIDPNAELTLRSKQLLQAGLDADMDGMLEASGPEAEAKRWYTVADVCRKLGVPTYVGGTNRKAVYRLFLKAHAANSTHCKQNKSKVWVMSSRIYDEYFGDFAIQPEPDTVIGHVNSQGFPDVVVQPAPVLS